MQGELLTEQMSGAFSGCRRENSKEVEEGQKAQHTRCLEVWAQARLEDPSS